MEANLPLFVLNKGKHDSKIEKSRNENFPAGIIGYVQAKGWMHNSTMGIWYNQIYRPYAFAICEKSELLMGDFKCHKNNELQELTDQDNALHFMIAWNLHQFYKLAMLELTNH